LPLNEAIDKALINTSMHMAFDERTPMQVLIQELSKNLKSPSQPPHISVPSV
jgi:hypothetical protein